MSEDALPKSLAEDIELISCLDRVEIRRMDGSLEENADYFEDESSGIQFADSSQGSDVATYNFEVRIQLSECVYAISKKKECAVTLHIELRDNLKYPLIDVAGITNASMKLRSKCEYYFKNLAFSGSSGSVFSLYKLIVDFQSFLEFDAQNADLHPISEDSSVVTDLITFSVSSLNEGMGTPGNWQYLSSNPYNDYYKNVSSYNERYRGTTRYNSLTIKRTDEIYGHLTSHSRYFREFKEESILGSGSFGSVARVLRNGINYAVKQIPIFENYESILHEEAAVLASLHHPNIVRYYDAWVELSPEYLINKFKYSTSPFKNTDNGVGNYGSNSFFNDIASNDIKNNEAERKNVVKFYNKHKKSGAPKKCLFILMEYCGDESLFEAINKHTLYESPQKVIELFRQLVEALSYIHEKGIIHRDVKPSNIFIKFDNEFLIKLGDFGLTAKLQQSKGDKGIVNENGLVGTLHYMAPEQSDCDSYNEKVDIYSAGVVLFEMLSKPFQTYMERSEILSSFSTPSKRWPEGFRERVDHRLFKLLESMLNINPDKRPSASEILQNEIFTSNKLDLDSLYTVITQYPHSMESVQLLSTIFSRKQQYKKLTDYYHTVTSNNVINYVNLELGLLYDKEFKLRNVHRTQLSLLTHIFNSTTTNSGGSTAATSSSSSTGVVANSNVSASATNTTTSGGVGERGDLLLLNNGRCCNLRFSLIHSLAECIPDETTTIIRRYAFVPVYPGGALGARPEGRNVAYFLAYDIIVDYHVILSDNQDAEMNFDSFFTYELVSVASRPLKRFIACTLNIEWSHSLFVDFLIANLNVAAELVPVVRERILGEKSIKGRIQGVSDETGALLGNVHSVLHKHRGRVLDLKRALEPLVKFTREFEDYFDKLLFFEKFLANFEGSHQFLPITTTTASTTTSGGGGTSGGFQAMSKFTFKIMLEIGKRNFGEVITGGCYDPIIENRVAGRTAFGFEMDLQPIYDYFTQNMVNKNLYNNLNLNYAPEVVVYTPQANLVTALTSLEIKLWRVGIKCYKKVGGLLNIKRIERLKRVGLFSLQKLKYLVTVKRSTETHEIQYILVDVNLENKETFGGEDVVLEYILHDFNPN